MRRKVLVDGYNVIRRDPLLSRWEQSSLQLARDTLLTLLNSSPRFKQDDVTVVFDGANSREAGVYGSRSFRRGRLQVVFSAPGQSADEVIKKLAADAPPGCIVVTADREIRDAVSSSGGKSANMAPRTGRPGNKPAGPRANGTSIKEDDYEPPSRSDKKGNPQRQPKRKRRPTQLDW